jgi:hypothetical protein
MSSQSFQFLPILNHDKYYLPGGDLYLLVKNTRFRIHKYFFERESVHFRTIFENSPSTGSTPSLALDLSGTIEPDVLELFLEVIYNPKYNIYNLTVGQWFDVQTYAQIWQFNEMYTLTVKELDRIRVKEESDPEYIEAIRSYELRQQRQLEKYLEDIYMDDEVD